MFLHPLVAVMLAAPAPASAPVDFILDAPSGPILVGVHIEVDGKSLEEGYKTAQRDYLRALFTYLDRNKDGFLDEAEARRAPLPLVGFDDLSGPDIHIAFNFRALDADGDGRVSLDELTQFYRDFEDAPFALSTGRASFASTPDLFELFDTDRDGKLSKSEMAAAAKVLASLDRDGDELLTPQKINPRPAETQPPGRFSVLEPQPLSRSLDRLKLLVGQPPGLELKVRLGEVPPGTPRLEVLRSAGKTIALHKVNGEAVLVIGGARVELRCDRSWLSPRVLAGLKQRYRRDVRPADADYLERVLELQARAMGRRVSLRASGPASSLWDLLDRNRDGVLGLREMRDAPKVLASLETDGDGFLSRDKVPGSFVLQFGLGRTHFNRLSGGEVVTLSPAGVLQYPGPDVGGGPLWFRKMDRNGDGDVSRSEFLGSPEEFKKLDLDGDGLISREEAEKAEEKR